MCVCEQLRRPCPKTKPYILDSDVSETAKLLFEVIVYITECITGSFPRLKNQMRLWAANDGRQFTPPTQHLASLDSLVRYFVPYSILSYCYILNWLQTKAKELSVYPLSFNVSLGRKEIDSYLCQRSYSEFELRSMILFCALLIVYTTALLIAMTRGTTSKMLLFQVQPWPEVLAPVRVLVIVK